MPEMVTLSVEAVRELVRAKDSPSFLVNLPYQPGHPERRIELGCYSCGEDPMFTFRRRTDGVVTDEVMVTASEIFTLAPTVRAILEREKARE